MTDNPAFLRRATLATNLRRLVALRWFVIAGCLALLLAAAGGVALVTAPPVAWAMLVIYTLANGAVRLYLRYRGAVSEGLFLANLVLDLGLLFVFLDHTGGSSNPFTLLFLVPVIVAAATLKPLAIWVVTVLAIGAYSLLLWRSPVSHHHHSMDAAFDLHVLGMWLGLVFVAALVAYFVTGMGRALRARERALAEARERALRDERVIALGAMAAGVAHELGTPLGTLAVLVRETERDAEQLDPCLDQRLTLMRAQVERCKSVLSGLSAHGHEVRAEAGRGLAPAAFVQTTVEHWRAFRPGIPVHVTWQGTQPERIVLADQTVVQALGGVLNNAADASPDTITVTGSYEGGELIIEIADRGPGVNRDIAERLGREPVSTKAEQGSMGIGMMLAHSVIERLGGAIDLRRADHGGTLVRVRLPLERLAMENTATR